MYTYTLPEDVEPLAPGYFVYAAISKGTYDRYYNRVRFSLLFEESVPTIENPDNLRWELIFAVEVILCNPDNLSVWGRPHERDLRTNVHVQHTEFLSADHADQFAAVLTLAASFASVMDESIEDQVVEYERKIALREAEEEQRREEYKKQDEIRREQRAKENAERIATQAKIEETLQWYLEQEFKLRRQHYKSTVFGRIKSIDNGYMNTISERGIPMQIRLIDITEFSIRYEGEKKYTNVYTKEGS